MKPPQDFASNTWCRVQTIAMRHQRRRKLENAWHVVPAHVLARGATLVKGTSPESWQPVTREAIISQSRSCIPEPHSQDHFTRTRFNLQNPEINSEALCW